MKKYILLLLILLLFQLIFSQSIDTIWTKTYGGVDYEELFCSIETLDSNYISVGYTTSYGAGGRDVYIISFNNNGDILWTKYYGGAESENAYCIKGFSNGYIIAGYTLSFGNGNNDYYLIRINADGDTLWTKTYGGADSDIAYYVHVLEDGFFIIGYTASYGNGNEDIYLIRTDTLGDTLWTKTYGGASTDIGMSILPNNNGFLIIGNTESYGNYRDIYLLQIDSIGDSLWAKTIGGNDYDYAQYAIKDSNSILIIGSTTSYGAGLYDYYIVKVDNAGDTLWTKTYGGTNNDYCTSICMNSNYYYIGGYSNSFASDYDPYILQLNFNGDSISSLIIHKSNYDEGINNMIMSNKSDIIFAGYTYSSGTGYNDAYIGMIFDNTSFIENNYNNVETIKTEFSDKLKFFIANPCNEIVNVNIYNSLGQRIANPVNNRIITGEFSYKINPGLYFYEIKIGKNIYKGKSIVF